MFVERATSTAGGSHLGQGSNRAGQRPNRRNRRIATRAVVASSTAFLIGLATFPGAADTTTTADSTTSSAPTTTAAPTTIGAPTTTAASTTAAAPTSTEAPATTLPAPSTTVAPSEDAVAKAHEVDAATARLGDLTDALAVAQSQVDTQEAKVKIAEQRLLEARGYADAVREQADELASQVAELEAEVGDQAIRTFKGDEVSIEVLTIGTNPNQDLRMQTMLSKATRSDIDAVVALALAREDLLAQRRDAESAATQAQAAAATTEEQLDQLEDNQAAQGDLVAAANDRLDRLLIEQSGLATLGGADQEKIQETQALVAQLSGAPRPPTSATSAPSTTVTDSDIQIAAKGIEVHVDIVDQIRRLLTDAAADGIELAGGGYRSPDGQIATRRSNCGASNYAIYEMPASRCRPPTARPGRSMHEQGKAIDFTYNGRLIRSRSGPGWNWLRQNAEKYGLFNLPSEPWHWSVNGR